MAILLADAGATKAEWRLLGAGKPKKIITPGISPYLLTSAQVQELLLQELLPKLKGAEVAELHYFGTGCGNPGNVSMLKHAFRKLLPGTKLRVDSDMVGAAIALCRSDKGIACILGTGSNSCFFNGKKIVKNNPALGFILGDEGSGAYLGKKVIQYYLYGTFDEELRARFDARFVTTRVEILDAVYKQPLPNRYLASFTAFLAENRGHYMIENIIEDGLNDFFYQHLYKYTESWKYPIHFAGGVAWGFRDVLQELCHAYELELGRVIRTPMDGLAEHFKQ
jgi:N-acetylglucosamine kinase-like BadF-type ATPase